MAAAPATAEAMGYCGFDFLVVDMEHVPIEISDLAQILRAIGCTPGRCPWCASPGTIRSWSSERSTPALKPSCCPSSRQRRRRARPSRSPSIRQQGVRGVAAVHRGSRFGRAPDYLKRGNDEICVIVQLETPEAIERLPEIAAVQGRRRAVRRSG